jgi:hypothetical protein
MKIDGGAEGDSTEFPLFVLFAECKRIFVPCLPSNLLLIGKKQNIERLSLGGPRSIPNQLLTERRYGS